MKIESHPRKATNSRADTLSVPYFPFSSGVQTHRHYSFDGKCGEL